MIVDDFDAFSNKWHDQIVEFELFGQQHRGRIVETLDTPCAPAFLVAEFDDGKFTVEVGSSYENFRVVENETY